MAFTFKDYERLKNAGRVISETGNGDPGKPRKASAKFQECETDHAATVKPKKAKKDGKGLFSNIGSRNESKNGRNKSPSLICINFRNDGLRRDLDGQVASLLDCLVSEGILPDDSVQCLDRIVVTHERTKNIGFDVVIIED